MLVSIEGYNLTGCVFATPGGSLLSNLHVGVQVGREPARLVKADAPEAYWELDIHVDSQENSLDFRGPAVQGKRGERFVYLTWGELGRDKTFEMMLRAKLMLNRVDESTVRAALATGRLSARIDLTGDNGGPRVAQGWTRPPLGGRSPVPDLRPAP